MTLKYLESMCPNNWSTSADNTPMVELICPTCQEQFESEKSEAMPFCSARCQGIDLGRWLGEEHGIPLEPEDLEDHRSRYDSDTH